MEANPSQFNKNSDRSVELCVLGSVLWLIDTLGVVTLIACSNATHFSPGSFLDCDAKMERNKADPRIFYG